MEVCVQSRLLLEKLANSIYDRDPANPNPFFFTIKEAHIVEAWMNGLETGSQSGGRDPITEIHDESSSG